MNFKLNTITAKFSFAMLSILTLFGIFAVGFAYYLSATRFTEREATSVSNDVYQHSKLITYYFETSSNLAELIAENDGFKSFVLNFEEGQDVEELNKKLDNYNLGHKYSAIYLIDQYGKTLASTNRSFVGQNYAFRPYFQKAIEGNSYADVNLGVTSKELGYYFAHPIMIDDQIIGVAVIKMNPNDIKSCLEDNKIASLTDIMMVDHYGVIVGSTRNDRLYKSLGDIKEKDLANLVKENKYPGEVIQSMHFQEMLDDLHNVNEIKHYKTYDKEDSDNDSLLAVKVGEYDFYLAAEMDEKFIKNEARRLGSMTGMMVGGIVAGIIIFSLWLISKLLHPIEELSAMSRQIAIGNLDVVNPLSGTDELAALGQTMETMANSIKRKYEELEHHVDERTKELKSKTENLLSTKTALANVLEDVEETAADLEKFKLAVDNASDHILITDEDGTILYANKGVERITGFKVDSVVGKKAGSKLLWGGLMGKSFYKKMWKKIKIDKENFDGELKNKKKNGEVYIAQTNISPILNSRNEVEFFVAIERDITHEKEIDRMKTDFISLASHQLRTPLSAIRWFAEMLLAEDAGKINKEQREYLDNIYQSNDRMINLVNSLLNISRIESGRIIVDPEPTNLKSLLTDVLTEVDNKIKEKKQSVILSVHEDLPEINIDPKLIREVYKNLITNANKYTQVGGEISIFVSKNGKDVVSQVSDNGIGIPKSSQPKVFERFYRAENIIKLETEGTGLGLYLAKAIVESSKGRIWFESEENKGTTFWFTLPLAGVKAKKGEVRLNS